MAAPARSPLRWRGVAAMLVLSAGTLAADPVAVDVDADLMRGIDDTTKGLDSDVALKDAARAAGEARELAELFARIEAHYAARGDAPDAVDFARRTRLLAARAQEAVAAQDFEAAGGAVVELTRTCKACHQAYRKDR